MISFILLWWIGMQLSAPVWYFALLCVSIFIQVLNFGMKMYKAGAGKE